MILRSLLLTAALVGVAASASAQSVAYLSSDTGYGPWGSSSYKEDFNKVFGEKGWRESTFGDNDSSFFDPNKTNLLVLEGGDWMADDLNKYLDKNFEAISKYVFEGGSLIVNAAPNTGGDISFGHGNFGIHYPQYNYTATPADFSHPIFNGPFGQVKELSSNYAAHATIWDKEGDFQPLMTGEDGGVELAQASYGKGMAILGGLTTPYSEAYNDPNGQWHTFNENLLAYGAKGNFVGTNTQAVPEPTSLAAIGLGAMTLIRRRKAKKA